MQVSGNLVTPAKPCAPPNYKCLIWVALQIACCCNLSMIEKLGLLMMGSCFSTTNCTHVFDASNATGAMMGKLFATHGVF